RILAPTVKHASSMVVVIDRPPLLPLRPSRERRPPPAPAGRAIANRTERTRPRQGWPYRVLRRACRAPFRRCRFPCPACPHRGTSAPAPAAATQQRAARLGETRRWARPATRTRAVPRGDGRGSGARRRWGGRRAGRAVAR